MSRITTHVLDVAAGLPAASIPVHLEQLIGNEWHSLATATTDTDGRARLVEDGTLTTPGDYRLTFAVTAYFAATATDSFYSTIPIIFRVRDADHYHIPLLLSPFGYSTYRGS